jgi:osmoprotectant transport system substrate-binding protein
MDHGIMYRSIGAKEVDVINSYTTDGQLQEYDLRVLEDDKSFFPPYHALPLVRKEALKEYPELEEVLKQLEGMINEEAMQKMNGKVDNDGMMVEQVATDFLIESGLIEKK